MEDGSSNVSGGSVSMDAVVRELLGLDPAALVRLGDRQPSEGDVECGALCRAGLSVLMRRVLDLAGRLSPQENASIRLETQTSARAAGWPDARTANLALLLTWGLIGEDRRREGLPTIPLLSADANVTSMLSAVSAHEAD